MCHTILTKKSLYFSLYQELTPVQMYLLAVRESKVKRTKKRSCLGNFYFTFNNVHSEVEISVYILSFVFFGIQVPCSFHHTPKLIL